MDRKIFSSLLLKLKPDFISGLQVSLIALPLSLGIALASGFPPMSGIISAIIGGMIVSRLCGSHLTINGPAAGLIVVVLASVENLGQGDFSLGYQYTLAAIFCAGILQIIFSKLRLGKYASFFPVSVVHGMMSAIGIIIIVKQLPIMLGIGVASKSILGILAELPFKIAGANMTMASIGILSLSILIIYPFLNFRPLKKIPAPVMVVVLTSFITYFLGSDIGIEPNMLLRIPANILMGLHLPNFSHALTFNFFIATITITLIASIESLLTSNAIEKIDSLKRKVNLNKDLFAIGVGTMTSSLLGGLPMISEVIRSSANVAHGAKSRWSNFFHGIFILVAILCFPTLLNRIPLAALAALLVFTGYRLSSPKEFIKVKKIGGEQLLIFVTTIVAILSTDLLIGVLSGILLKILVHLLRGVSLKEILRCHYNVIIKNQSELILKVNSALLFSNFFTVMNFFEKIPPQAKIVIDLTQANYIDHTSLELIHFEKFKIEALGGRLLILESSHHKAVSNHELAVRRLTIS